MGITKKWSRNKGLLNIDPNQTGLVAGYNMFPRQGVVQDLSGNGNHGTVSGPIFEHSEIGPSMKFDGVDDEITSANNVDVSQNFSWCCWFKIKGDTGSNQTLLSRRDDSSKKVYIRIIQVAGAADAVLQGSLATVSGIRGPGSTSVKDGMLHHMALTVDITGNAIMYIDSIPGTPKDVSGVGDLGTGVLEIGNRVGVLQLIGNLSNIKMFSNKILTASEIQAEYQAGAKAVNWKSDYGVALSTGAESSGNLSDSPARIISGTHKFDTDTIGGKTCKVVEGVTTGIVEMSTGYFFGGNVQAAYGTNEFYFNKADATVMTLGFVSDISAVDTSAVGYQVVIDTDESIEIRRVTGSGEVSLMKTAAAFITAGSWYKLKLQRKSDGELTVYLGTVLLDVSGGSGTNPVTDNTVTESIKWVMGLGAADKVAWSDLSGGHSITKYQGVV